MNARNILTSLLAVRALLETLAHFHDFVTQLARAVENEDLSSVDRLVMHRTFNTRDTEWLEQYPEYKASVLNAIDKLSDIIPSAREHYEALSEFCHPNYYGHHLNFSTLDQTTGTVTYSDLKRFPKVFVSVLPTLTLLLWFEGEFEELGELIPEIARIQSSEIAKGPTGLG
jgi:hypothetical protein